VWLAGLIAFTYIMGNSQLHEMEVNLFVALIIDIFAVAIIKGSWIFDLLIDRVWN